MYALNANASSDSPPPLWLASASPRRRQLLAQAAIEHRVIDPGIDDAALRPRGPAGPGEPGRCDAASWAMSLAHLKARSAAELLRAAGHTHGLVLAADTVCAVDDRILGQPADERDARDMIQSLAGRSHRTITGVCIIPVTGRGRLIVHDAAVVHIDRLTDQQIDEYVRGGTWRGKAGAYNLAERLAAGWPIFWEGDETTVMGLPMRRLPRWLEQAAAFLEKSE